MNKRIIRIIRLFAIILTVLGTVTLSFGIYLKSVVNSTRFLEIADASIKQASAYIKRSQLTFKYGVIAAIAGIAILSVMIFIIQKHSDSHVK